MSLNKALTKNSQKHTAVTFRCTQIMKKIKTLHLRQINIKMNKKQMKNQPIKKLLKENSSNMHERLLYIFKQKLHENLFKTYFK